MSTEPKLSVPHAGCRFNQCIIKFNTAQTIGQTKTPRSDTGKELMDEVVKALVYMHGYEGAHQMFNKRLDELKFNWQE